MPALVLVVDDSSVARKILVRSLPKGWASEICHAASGVEALAAYRARRPDVMFLDLNMPEMDGYQVLAALHDEPPGATVIVLSGDIQPKAQERVMALGAKAFLKKPASVGELAEALHGCGLL